MKVSLKGMSRRELEKLRANIDKALERLAATEKKEALAAAEKAARSFGYSLSDLTGDKKVVAAVQAPAKKKNNDGRAKVAPKFRNPDNPDETWSGRGRPPGWMAAHLAAGGRKDDLAI